MERMMNKPLTQIGDQMQSAASRMAEWIAEWGDDPHVPYEVRMAVLEAESAIADWTAARSATAEPYPSTDNRSGDNDA